METAQMKNQITEGVIWKQLLMFFFPIMIGTFFQQLYNTIDTVVVGQFVGTKALASVGGSSSQMINLVVGFFTGLSSGASVIIAQYYGAKDEEFVRKGIHNAYAIAAAGGIFLSIVGIALAPAMLRMMNTPSEIVADSTLYLRVYFSGLSVYFCIQHWIQYSTCHRGFPDAALYFDCLLYCEYCAGSYFCGGIP